MCCNRIFATLAQKGSFYRWRIKKRVIVHQVTLVGIAAPHPSVAFNPVDKKLAGIEVEGIFGNVVNLVQLRI
ncbi:hypothetical protein D3C85_928210 [compost metagenome]